MACRNSQNDCVGLEFSTVICELNSGLLTTTHSRKKIQYMFWDSGCFVMQLLRVEGIVDVKSQDKTINYTLPSLYLEPGF